MLGKRPRQMRRTVSVSMMGPGSIPSEAPTVPDYPKEKQKPHVEAMASSNFPISYPARAQLAIPQVESGTCYAAPVLPFPFEANHSGSRPWERREVRAAVGLSIVAALHGTDPASGITNVGKDGRERARPAVEMTHRPIYQSKVVPSAQQASHIPQKLQHHHVMEIHGPHGNVVSGSFKDASTSSVSPGMHFLEVCCHCRRRLSHGRDIYMYRGDKAFCSEECRHQQILVDERKEKCFLTALKMRTAVQPTHSSGQQSRAMATGTAAAG
ncbi:hypothetical protein O6H91_03G062900 [Diphasiastrum complanatum]|uniref:Uncharacterized protein n=3 Tax=Diphasiastrum complanatum TaxID=34168 RepID=A0ACC2E7C3_DIPCM|nr:hypothetical protein O6H91_03G062900 [Diphasiastrum complanatum]KAJ7562298.1 hypothetical protein O6H91_03G062900 [Diphasiastrum complanatum]KAJ7562299.1 hypothetical protein O6H91_03G062900 [Diphasiastrum complanatum]